MTSLPPKARRSGPQLRERGGLLWVAPDVNLLGLQKQGWKVLTFRDLRSQFIQPARSRGTARTSLGNPSQPLLALIAETPALAVVGVSLRTATDLRDLYGFVIEPAFRLGTSLLIAADRELDDLEEGAFTDPVGYAWTLERLRYIGARFRLGPAADGLPPMTPIEELLFAAMRKRGLAPVTQYGIGPYRADFAFPDVRLVVECDGRPWHDPDRDRRRDEALRRKGWEPVHFTGSEISRDAAACAARVLHEVRQRQSTAESEQPEVLVPIRRSWWARLVAWLRARYGSSPATGSAPGRPAADPEEDDPDNLPPWAAKLDARQAEAVMSHDGVVQVIAPAGSGKTTVLVSRVRELAARGVPPNRILCCTFNSAAADELQTRLDRAGIEGVKASTFHAAGRQVLKRAELLRDDLGTISYGQWRRLASQAMNQTTEGIWIEAPDARDQVSDLKLGRMVTVDEYTEIATSPAERTLATLYRLYEATLEEQKRNDFDDLIFGAVRLLQRDAGARHHWQGEYSAVLVDEYQDIEPAQELLVQILAAPEDLLLCVGDEDQCLYAWRRASVERVIELDQIYPGLERHALERNYRCPVTVVDASRGLISRNRHRFPKQILAARPEPGEITLAAAVDLPAQAAHAARLVKDLEQGQAVILARTSRLLSEIALGLAQAGIRYFGPERIKRRGGEPAILLSYLRLLAAPALARPEDVDAVFRVPNRYLPNEAEESLASGLRNGLSFADAVGRLKVRDEWRRPKLADAARLFDELSRIENASNLIHRLRTDGGLDRHYADAEQHNPTDQSAIDTLEHAEDASAGMTTAEYAAALDYEASIIEQHFDSKGIELATIHGAKGRQWPLVIVAGVQEGELPHARSVNSADDPEAEMEGERRLAYVAFTRASERLVLLHAADRPSRFIAEAALRADVIEAATPLSPSAVEPTRTGGTPIPPSRPAAAGVASHHGITRAPAAPLAHPAPPAQALAAPPGAETSSARALDGTIPCSMPGCGGRVGAAFVCESPAGLVGLCPRYEIHEAMAASDRGYEAVWVDLKSLSDQARRRWRNETFGGQTDELDCAVPGCGGTVKPEYQFYDDMGELRGICAQRLFHEALGRRDPAVGLQLRQLLDGQRGSYARGSGPADRRADLLAIGGIPCSIPGCDGVVGVQYVVESDEGPIGVCGIWAVHSRLIATDPEARRIYRHVQEVRDASGSAPVDDLDLDDLPF